MQNGVMKASGAAGAVMVRLDEATVRGVMAAWRMLGAAGPSGMTVSLPVALETSSVTVEGPFAVRGDLEVSESSGAEISGGVAVVSPSGVRFEWQRAAGGVGRSTREVPVQVWAALEAQWFGHRVLVTEALSAHGPMGWAEGALVLPLTGALRNRVRAAVAWLDDHGPGRVAVDVTDVTLRRTSPQDTARLPGALTVDPSGTRVSVTVHQSQVAEVPAQRLQQAAVIVTGGTLSLRAQALDGRAVGSRPVRLWRLGFGDDLDSVPGKVERAPTSPQEKTCRPY